MEGRRYDEPHRALTHRPWCPGPNSCSTMKYDGGAMLGCITSLPRRGPHQESQTGGNMTKRSDVQLAENPKEAFGRYIIELETEYYDWYTTASNRNKYMFVALQCLAIVSGAATAIVAAIVSDTNRKEWRLVLVLLPLLGTFATALLAQTRLRDVLALRERGREQLQKLISNAKVEYAASSPDTDVHFTRVHKTLVEEISRIERQQALDVLSIAATLGTTPLPQEPTSTEPTRDGSTLNQGPVPEAGEPDQRGPAH